MKGVVFDMDGLMLDTERVSSLALDHAGEKTGIGPAGFMTVRLLGLSPAAAKEIFSAEFGGAYDDGEFRRCADEFRAAYFAAHGVPEKPGLHEALELLSGAGFRLAVASSTDRRTVLSHLGAVGVRDFFDAVVCGDMVEHYKPDPEIYLRACAEIGLSPRECWALDDAPAGVASASAAGCRVIMVPDLAAPDEISRRNAYAVVDDLLSAAELIAGGGARL